VMSKRLYGTSAILLALATCLVAPPACAQQNLFNVPSAEITEKGAHFFQQQFNVTNKFVSNSTLDYGLGDGLEAGINLFVDTTDLYDRDADDPALVLGNVQRGFELSETYKLGLGTQSGISIPVKSGSAKFADFTYLTNALDFKRYGKYYFGGYYANEAYGAGGTPVGYTVGIDLPILPGHLNFMADMISGNGPMSVAVVGVVVYLLQDWQLSVGEQLPTPNSNNDYGVVVEFTNLSLEWF